MLVNANFTRRAMVAPHEYKWVPSPQTGIERVMLDRVGGEQARATSIVRYAPDSHFPSHAHPGGEEIFVLSGVFSEGEDHYTAGWYLRNPPGSSHQPSSADGAMIFVKLCQMGPLSMQRVRIDTTDPSQWQQYEDRAVCPLFSDEVENVSLQRLAPRSTMSMEGPVEVLVLDGKAEIDGKICASGTWMRWPIGDKLTVAAEAQGASLYIKVMTERSVAVEEAYRC